LQGTRWFLLNIGPAQLLIDLRKALESLIPPKILPSTSWLLDYLKVHTSAADSSLTYNVVNKFKTAKLLRSVEEVQTQVTELRRELPAQFPESFLIYWVISNCPESLRSRLMFARDANGGNAEWTKWADF
jgi:hypothetical protein